MLPFPSSRFTLGLSRPSIITLARAMKTPLRRRLSKRKKWVQQVAALLHPGAVVLVAGGPTSFWPPKLKGTRAKQVMKQSARGVAGQDEEKDGKKASLVEETEEVVAEAPRDQQTTVYCEGLSYEATESDVMSFFAPLEVKEVRMPRYQDSGKPRGYAHVEFWRESDAAAALSRDRQNLKGRYVTVRPARDKARVTDRPRPQGCRTVFVKNIPYDTSEDAVRNVFNRFGKVEDVRLPNWQHTKRLKGHGYVQFVREFHAELAFKQQHTLRLKGRELRVDYAEEQRPKASFRTPNGTPWVKTKVGKRITRHGHIVGTSA